MNIRTASFALRVVRRREGDAGILYRRTLDTNQNERLTRIGSISSIAFSAGTKLLRCAVRATAGPGTKLTTGPFHALDPDWGARVACYALTASGLRNPERLHKAADHLLHADGPEAAWWFGLMGNGKKKRVIRALRILVEAVK